MAQIIRLPSISFELRGSEVREDWIDMGVRLLLRVLRPIVSVLGWRVVEGGESSEFEKV
jgi:hypothetical protein